MHCSEVEGVASCQFHVYKWRMPSQHSVHAFRLLDADAELLAKVFREFWELQEEEAAMSHPTAEPPSEGCSASLSEAPAIAITSAEERLSKATADALARLQFGGRTAPEAGALSQQGRDVAADVAADRAESSDS